MEKYLQNKLKKKSFYKTGNIFIQGDRILTNTTVLCVPKFLYKIICESSHTLLRYWLHTPT